MVNLKYKIKNFWGIHPASVCTFGIAGISATAGLIGSFNDGIDLEVLAWSLVTPASIAGVAAMTMLGEKDRYEEVGKIIRGHPNGFYQMMNSWWNRRCALVYARENDLIREYYEARVWKEKMEEMELEEK